jgi:hypothetical protein
MLEVDARIICCIATGFGDSASARHSRPWPPSNPGVHHRSLRLQQLADQSLADKAGRALRKKQALVQHKPAAPKLWGHAC